ncbi:hypothetical protein [Sulfuracidifex tepidarius]|uniref:Uncharacterized protein n=1 Tax=Sulfuracidifex tepidarius TaxID=1294262 RepID=A0A510E5Y3_9CREN|nr:hypothetical protein [Sulfuracidifex tepidarius]BBG27458.1 hypothetical protein IC007_2012 [Sulfuracidifex tepidarius]
MSELDFLLGGAERREDKVERIEKTRKGSEETEESRTEPVEKSWVGEDRTSTSRPEDRIEELMRKFVNKDPKIGVWSYPSFLLLQYLYNTIPGFKMSKVAKEALEKGLKEMYPDLFKKAEEIYRSSFSNV